jgi:hypothetical protein
VAYALVQSTNLFRSGTTNPTIAAASNLTAGNLAVLTGNAWQQQLNSCSFSVGSSPTPSEALQVGEGDASDFAYIFYSANTASGAHTAQFATSFGVDVWMVFAEFSGIATTTPLDQTSSGAGTSTTLSSGATGTLAQAGELVVGQVWHASSTGDTITATGTLTASPQQNLDNGGSQAGTFSHGRSTSTSAVTATWSDSASQAFKALVATFKETSAPATTGAATAKAAGRVATTGLSARLGASTAKGEARAASTGISARSAAAVERASARVSIAALKGSAGLVTVWARGRLTVTAVAGVPGQTAAPVSDVGIWSWTDADGATVNLYQTVDEVVASDADYVQSALAPTADLCRLRLAPLTDPAVGTGHIVSYRYRKDTTGGDQVDLIVRLYRADGTTVVASQTHTNVPATATDGSFTLSSLEADSIPAGDYATGLVIGLEATSP